MPFQLSQSSLIASLTELCYQSWYPISEALQRTMCLPFDIFEFAFDRALFYLYHYFTCIAAFYKFHMSCLADARDRIFREH